jgi:hypothetical protein
LISNNEREPRNQAAEELSLWVPTYLGSSAVFVVPTAIGIIRAIADISSEKATGLAAVAGGVGEVVATFGLMVLFAAEIVGSVLLVRRSSRNHPIRTVVAIVSVFCGGLLPLVLGLFLWFAIVQHGR